MSTGVWRKGLAASTVPAWKALLCERRTRGDQQARVQVTVFHPFALGQDPNAIAARFAVAADTTHATGQRLAAASGAG